MKKLFITTAALMALSAPVYAGGGNGNNGGGGHGGGGYTPSGPTFSSGGVGYVHGSAVTGAASAGGSLGNGNSFSKAGQFAGNAGSVGFKHTTGSNGRARGIEGYVTNDSYTEGFDRARSNGNAISGAVRGGAALGGGSYWAGTGTSW